MDFIILKSDGSLQKQSLTRYIQQGSHGVDEIFIGWANATSAQILQAVFTLPNKLTNTELGTFVSDYEYEPGETINGWVITLTENQTRYDGLLMVSARIILNGIVQVAYPFALCINETGVRPETDSGVTLEQLDSYLLNLQTLVTGAVQQNTDAVLSNTSENPVQNKVITSALENFKRDSYKLVDTTEYPTLQDFLDSEGEEGYLYLYPIDPSDESAGFYRYIWENNAWVSLGTTVIDLSNMVTTDTNQDIDAQKNIINGKKINFVYGYTNWWIKNGNGELDFGLQENNLKFSLTTANATFDTNIVPYSNNSKSLGDSTHAWKDAYLSGSAIFNESTDTTNYWSIREDAYGNLVVGKTGNNRYMFNNTFFGGMNNGERDLGSTQYTWKDLYLSGIANLGSKITFSNNPSTYYIEITAGGIMVLRSGGNNIWCQATFVPYDNNGFDLGRSNRSWKDLYLTGNLISGSASRTVGGLSGKTGAPTVSSNTAELPYDTLSELSLSANTTINLQTAPTGCYPEYKAIITASAAITLTFTGVSNFLTNDEDNVVITNGTNTTVTLASGTTVEISIVNGKGVAINFGA